MHHPRDLVNLPHERILVSYKWVIKTRSKWVYQDIQSLLWAQGSTPWLSGLWWKKMESPPRLGLGNILGLLVNHLHAWVCIPIMGLEFTYGLERCYAPKTVIVRPYLIKEFIERVY